MPIRTATAHCFLTGPTASGKTALGVALAIEIKAEIISLDSMAVYRGMDIGTAKPTQEERCGVPHHLIDCIGPESEFTIADYVDAAHKKTAEITTRGNRCLFVGGTPLYLKALLRGLFEGPQADPELRAGLEDAAARNGPDYLHEQLRAIDRESAEKLHPNDHRRLIRAIEVYEKTGAPISRLQKQFDKASPPDMCRVVVLDWPRKILNARIDRRVETMIELGLFEEARRLFDGIARPGKTAMQAVGYRECFEYFDGVRSREETIELIKTSTRQFAKRQGTWFRSLSECRFFPMSEEEAVEETLQRFLTQNPDFAH